MRNGRPTIFEERSPNVQPLLLLHKNIPQYVGKTKRRPYTYFADFRLDFYAVASAATAQYL